MDPSERRRIDQLFTEALERRPNDRSAFLDERCGGDVSLRSAVERLLASADAPGDFLTPGGALQGSVWRAYSFERAHGVPPPKRVGVYRIAREIGRGGMSVVYLGERDDGAFEQRVALKLIKPGTDTQEVLQRFEQERQILASLNHPAIARLYDGGSTEAGHPYFVMELVEGEPIDMYCRVRGLPVEEMLELFITVCEAVHHAHEQNIVHRDLKPSNILVTGSGQVKLLDFGIAKALDPQALPNSAPATRAAQRLLTPEFASPEQVRGEPVTAASDIYQLGVLLYLLLTGQLPYRPAREGMEALVHAICEQAPLPPSREVTLQERTDETARQPHAAALTFRRLDQRLQDDLDVIVLKALCKEPERRYASAAAFAADVRRHRDASTLSRVVYEMLTGPQSGAAREPSSQRTPKADASLPALPPAARDIVERYLGSSGRLIADGNATAHRARGRRSLALPWLVGATALAAVAVAAVIWNALPSAPPAPVTRFSIAPNWQDPFLRDPVVHMVAVSPDGMRIVHAAEGGGFALRNLAETESRPIPGTGQFVGEPSFSPDGASIVYAEAANVIANPNSVGPAAIVPPIAVRKIAVTGGTPVTLSEGRDESSSPTELRWESDDTILFVEHRSSPTSITSRIMRMPANGGAPELLVEPKAGEVLGRPSLLPGGEWLLFSALPIEKIGAGVLDSGQIVAQSLRSGERRLLWEGGTLPRFVSTGHLVYAQGNKLFAVPFDLDELEVTGEPIAVIDGLRGSTTSPYAAADYAMSQTGSLVYVSSAAPGAPVTEGVVALASWDGAVRRLRVPVTRYKNPRVSPDGRQLAVQIIERDGSSDVWIYDLSEEFEIRPLTQGGTNTSPIWTPDAKEVTFASNRDGNWAIFSQRVDGSTVAERLLTAEDDRWYLPESWSPDGRTLAVTAQGDIGTRGFGPSGQGTPGFGANRTSSLWLFSRDTGAFELFHDQPTTGDFGAAFSPDGKWLAYVSLRTRSAAWGTELQPFPPTGVIHQLIQDDWLWPAWSPDGTRLLLRSNLLNRQSARLLSVDISTDGRPAIRNRRVLPIEHTVMEEGTRDYDVTSDGHGFVLIVPSDDPRDPPDPQINVVLNWFEDLRSRVRAR